MRLGSIDMGSNTVRLLVADMEGGALVPVRYERTVTRLASGMHDRGVLEQGRLEATASALEEFLDIAKAEGAVKVLAFGTSALREARNKEAALSALKRAASGHHGVELRVISGLEEAHLTAEGVLAAFGQDSMQGSEALIMDIGGGSTELIHWSHGDVKYASSHPLGVVRLQDLHLKSTGPLGAEELRGLEEDIAKWCDKISSMINLAPGAMFIGTAGTATTLASISLGLREYDWRKVQGFVLGLDSLETMRARLSGLCLEDRKAVPGLEPSRADLIIPGITLTIMLMKTFGFTEMRVSDHGLLEGMLIRLHAEVSGSDS